LRLAWGVVVLIQSEGGMYKKNGATSLGIKVRGRKPCRKLKKWSGGNHRPETQVSRSQALRCFGKVGHSEPKGRGGESKDSGKKQHKSES